jgi:hypothetical protein
LTDDEKVKVICTYLASWEKVVDFSFTQSSAKNAGAAIKMAGLKYMLLLLPAFWERAVTSTSKFNSAFIGKKKLKVKLNSNGQRNATKLAFLYLFSEVKLEILNIME